MKHQITANDIFIAPLVLLVFIENAFKHGFGTLASHAYIHIKLHNDEESIYFTVKNNFGEVENNSEKGLGLDNVKRRLSLLYPGMYDLKNDWSQGEDMVQLAIKYD